MDDRREELSEIDRALIDALDVDASPDFEARVRRRIATEPRIAPLWRIGRNFLLPAAAAAALMAATGEVLKLSRPSPAPRTVFARPVDVGPMTPADVRPRPVNREVERREAVTRVAQQIARAAVAEPEVLVPREEIEMYRRLFAAAQAASSAVVVETPKDIVPTSEFSAIAIEPIKIDPIVPPERGEGDRQ